MVVLIFSTAPRQPRPAYRFPPSRSSIASCVPVDAPEGIETVASAPPRRTRASIVGRARLSRISRALSESIVCIEFNSHEEPFDQLGNRCRRRSHHCHSHALLTPPLAFVEIFKR